MSRILMVVSGANSLTMADGSAHPTGFWAEELAESHRVLVEAGAQVDIATPGGVRPTVDPVSLDERGGVAPADAERFGAYLDAISDELAKPLALSEVSTADYAAVFIPGGHGPMADLAHDSDLGRLLVEADGRGLLITVLCHGPAALLSTSGAGGGFPFAGRRLTTFTDEEELQGGVGANAPYFVEARLRELGAVIEVGPAWTSKVVVDGNLISGQNPQSSVETAQRVLAALNA